MFNLSTGIINTCISNDKVHICFNCLKVPGCPIHYAGKSLYIDTKCTCIKCINVSVIGAVADVRNTYM